MKRVWLATLVLALGAGTASAAPLTLNGSDTLFDFTTELLKPAHCNVDPNKLIYGGGGSSLGETNMVSNQQQIAPMSRALGGAGLVAGQSQGCKIGLDGLAILTDDSEPNTCNTAVYSATMEVDPAANGIAGFDDGVAAGCPDCTAGGSTGQTYVFTDWRDVLRIVYGGQTEHKTTTACAEAPVGRSATSTQRCNSDVRATLVNNWEKLFQEGSGCNGTDPDACTQLRHAFRRDDLSGTTDVFLETLGLPKIALTGTIAKPFCNGAEMEDEDPIRRNCSEVVATGDEQVCNAAAKSLLGPSNTSTFGSSSETGWRGGPTSNPADANSADLGLVLSVVIPQVSPYQDITACSTGPFGGSFRYATMPSGAITAAQQKCPDGTKPLGGQCAWPARKVGSSYFFGCVNKKANIPSSIATITNMDGRVYNLIARNPDGSMQTVERIISGTVRQIPVHHAVYRIHETAVMPGGVPDATFTTGCRYVDATDQIGCLVHASPCSIGYAGLLADDRDPNKTLALQTPDGSGPVQPTPTTVRRLNDPFGTGCETAGDYEKRYPLSRTLYFNSTKGFTLNADNDPYAHGFDNIGDTNAENQLVKCACDRFYADPLINQFGFITLSDLPAGTCPAAGTHGTCDTPIRNY